MLKPFSLDSEHAQTPACLPCPALQEHCLGARIRVYPTAIMQNRMQPVIPDLSYRA